MIHQTVSVSDIENANIHRAISHRYGKEGDIAMFFKNKCAERVSGQPINYLLGKEEVGYYLNPKYVPDLYAKLNEVGDNDIAQMTVCELPSPESALTISLNITFNQGSMAAMSNSKAALFSHADVMSAISKFNKKLMVEIFNANFGANDTQIEQVQRLLSADGISLFRWMCYVQNDKLVCVFPSLRIPIAQRFELLSRLGKSRILAAFAPSVISSVSICMDSHIEMIYLPKTNNGGTRPLFEYALNITPDISAADIPMEIVETPQTTSSLKYMNSIHYEPDSTHFVFKPVQDMEAGSPTLEAALIELETSIEKSPISNMNFELPFILATLKITPIECWLDANKLFEMCYAYHYANVEPEHLWDCLGAWISIKLYTDRTKWNTFKKEYMSIVEVKERCVKLIINHIIHVAKTNNPHVFHEMRREHIAKRVLDFIDEYDEAKIPDMIAGMLLSIYCMGDIIVDVSSKTAMGAQANSWFMFHNNHMARAQGEKTIYKWVEYPNRNIESRYRTFIAFLTGVYAVVQNKFVEIGKGIKMQIKDIEPAPGYKRAVIPPYLSARNKEIDAKIGSIKAAKIALLSTRPLGNIITSAATCLMEYNFRSLLDQDKGVIGVGNGVIELFYRNPDTGLIEPRFIGEFHTHLVSRFMKTDYVPYDPNDPITQHVEAILKSIIVEEDAYEKIMMLIASGLYGGSKATVACILKAGGANGKSTIGAFISNTFGEYVVPGRTTLITSPVAETSSSANSAFVSLAEKLYVIFSEFKNGDRINDMLLKKIISQETQTGRQLYKEETSMKINAVPFIFINVALNIDATDTGTWRRLEMYNCKTQYVNEPDPAFPNQKKKDAKIMDNHVFEPKYHSAFLSIVLQYFARLHNEYGGDVTTIPSKTMTEEKEEFALIQNKFIQFKSRFLQPIETTLYTRLSLIAESYVEFLGKLNVRTTQAQAMDDLLNSALNKNIISHNNIHYLSGYKLLTEDEVRQLESVQLTDLTSPNCITTELSTEASN